MNITITEAPGNISVIRPEGRINLGNTDELLQKAKALYEQGARKMIVDLSEVESMSSAGLRTLLSVAKMLNKDSVSTGGNESREIAKSRFFKLASPDPDLKNVLDIAGFLELVEVYDDLNDAIASF